MNTTSHQPGNFAGIKYLSVLALMIYAIVSVPSPAQADNLAAADITYEAAQSDEYSLTILVNSRNPIPIGITPKLVSIGSGHKIDARAYDDFIDMMDNCRALGLHPKVRSSWRSAKKQTSLYNNKVNRLMRAGMDQTSALSEAMTVVAYPGTSEHQLGLALDIVDSGYQELETEQENTEVQQWLIKNSWHYGFILRYPSDKCKTTGIIYEPWHYRYVGKAVAREIFLNGMCLEEYYEKCLNEKYYYILPK